MGEGNWTGSSSSGESNWHEERAVVCMWGQCGGSPQVTLPLPGQLGCFEEVLGRSNVQRTTPGQNVCTSASPMFLTHFRGAGTSHRATWQTKTDTKYDAGRKMYRNRDTLLNSV